MQQRIYRGKRKDTGTWVIGSVLYKNDTPYIITNAERKDGLLTVEGYEVLPVTVSEYVYVEDKNGVKVFSGDVLKNSFGYIMEVVYVPKWHCYGYKYFRNGIKLYSRLYGLFKKDIEVIGNIFDDEELFNELS